MEEKRQDFTVDVRKVMDEQKSALEQAAMEKHNREDEELLKMIRESVKIREAKRLSDGNDVMVKAVNKARRANASGLNINIRGAENSSRVRVNVDDGKKSELQFANICSGITLVLALAIFAMKLMEVVLR